MNFVTALFLPSTEWGGECPGTTARFAGRWLRGIHISTASAMPTVKRNQGILGDSLTVVLDSGLKGHPNGRVAYDAVAGAGLNILEVRLEPRGAWSNKWNCILAALGRMPGPTTWMDFMDVAVSGRLSEVEEAHLMGALGATGLVIEWERFRCFGPSPSDSSGNLVGRRIRQPQTSIFCVADGTLPEECLGSGIDHDQVALLHVLQRRMGLFQDRIPGRVEGMSSRGLFKVLPDAAAGNLVSTAEPLFRPKFFHKQPAQ